MTARCTACSVHVRCAVNLPYVWLYGAESGRRDCFTVSTFTSSVTSPSPGTRSGKTVTAQRALHARSRRKPLVSRDHRVRDDPCGPVYPFPDLRRSRTVTTSSTGRTCTRRYISPMSHQSSSSAPTSYVSSRSTTTWICSWDRLLSSPVSSRPRTVGGDPRRATSNLLLSLRRRREERNRRGEFTL